MESSDSDSKRLTCPDCGREFHPKSLGRHRKIHAESGASGDVEQSRKRKKNKKYAVIQNDENENPNEVHRCTIGGCQRIYHSFGALQRHCRLDHEKSILQPRDKVGGPIACFSCDASFTSVAALCEHVRLNKDHWDNGGLFGLTPYSPSRLTLESRSAFEAWKEKVETGSTENFVRAVTSKAKDWRLDTYFCCRSGKSRAAPREKESFLPNTRCPSRTPSKKIGFHCTAFIKAKKLNSG